jgi:Helix-turn-helix domain of resolvase
MQHKSLLASGKVPKQQLAEEYDVALSTVKRLLRKSRLDKPLETKPSP